MSFIQTILLGAIAGFTIYLGLPIGRIEKISDRVRSFLTMTSVGILIFLLFDIFSHIKEPIEGTLKQTLEGKAGASEFVLLLIILLIGFGVGLLGLLAFELRFTRASRESGQSLSPARLAVMIATGLGLHNFSEGLAIDRKSTRLNSSHLVISYAVFCLK